MQELQENYEEELLSYLPNPDDSLASALLYAVLSSHAPNEEYLDHAQPQWIEVLLTPCSCVCRPCNRDQESVPS